MDEPALDRETQLQETMASAVDLMLRTEKARFVLIERYGLDISVFLEIDGRHRFRQIELKVFTSAAGRVGIGDGTGGRQVDLFWDFRRRGPRSTSEFALLDHSIRWMLADCSKQRGTQRYAFFNVTAANAAAARGEVYPGKQNNLRPTAFDGKWLVWADAMHEVREFLLT